MKRWMAAVMGVGLVWACGFDGSLREYLSVTFWSPFMKHPAAFERAGVKRANVAFAGMGVWDATPLGRLRQWYHNISQPQEREFDAAPYRAAVAAALADRSLSARDREEVLLIDAKIDVRLGDQNRPEPLRAAQVKLESFLKTATTVEWLSEARGWLAYTHYLLGDQTAAGKLYLDELNHDGSNVNRHALLNSLSMTYGYDGELKMLDHLEEYFDTAEHAVFAIQLATNPRDESGVEAYRRVNALLGAHRELLNRSEELPLLMMRVALRMGDPAQVVAVAGMVPSGARVRRDPDFLWMLGSAHFVSRDYAGAERPLVEMFGLLKDDDARKAAAAYGLCGVYAKSGNRVEQLRYGLWLGLAGMNVYYNGDADFRNMGVYWAFSGWDLKLVLEADASMEDLRAFLAKYPEAKNVRLVKYAIAVRLAREDRYAESAEVYESIGQRRRGPRMRELARLWADGSAESKVSFAAVLTEHGDGVYFNDSMWYGQQNYALHGDTETRFTKEERERQVALERELRDSQEEHWRAYKILREVMESEGWNSLGRKAGVLAQKNLRMIRTDRFGRAEEVAQADRDVTQWLRGK